MSLPFPDISQLAQQPCAISFNLSHFLRSDCEQSLSVPLLFFTSYFLNSDSFCPIYLVSLDCGQSLSSLFCILCSVHSLCWAFNRFSDPWSPTVCFDNSVLETRSLIPFQISLNNWLWGISRIEWRTWVAFQEEDRHISSKSYYLAPIGRNCGTAQIPHSPTDPCLSHSNTYLRIQLLLVF